MEQAQHGAYKRSSLKASVEEEGGAQVTQSGFRENERREVKGAMIAP